MHDLPISRTHARYLGPVATDPPVVGLPIGVVKIQLGFPSPAEDFQDDEIDLSRVLVRNPPATFL